MVLPFRRGRTARVRDGSASRVFPSLWKMRPMFLQHGELSNWADRIGASRCRGLRWAEIVNKVARTRRVGLSHFVRITVIQAGTEPGSPGVNTSLRISMISNSSSTALRICPLDHRVIPQYPEAPSDAIIRL